MISVLLPSRQREFLLRRSVQSLLGNAADPSGVEVLVAADQDDPGTVSIGEELGARVFVSSRHGYHQMHLYVNELARNARGEWLLLWNDDAVMQTPNWDSRINESPVGVLHPRSNHIASLNVFPVVSSKIIKALGHFSLSPHCDSWIFDAASEAGCVHPVDIDTLHDRFDMTGRNSDLVYQESQQGYRVQEYYDLVAQGLISRDAQLIREALRQ